MSKRDRIMLTRSAEDCAAWADELARRGAEPIVFPCIDTEIIDDVETRAALGRAIRGADWLVFTSKRGVSAFASLCGRSLPDCARIATVGASTADAARAALGRVDLVGAGGTAAALARDLIGAAPGSPRTLLVLAENAATVLEDALSAAGHHIERIDVYRTIPKPERSPKLRFSTFSADWVFLASPSSSTGFTNQIDLDCDARFVTIGPTTTQAARTHGLDPLRQARTPSLSGLMEAIECPA